MEKATHQPVPPLSADYALSRLNAFDSNENSHSPGVILHADEKAEIVPKEGEREGEGEGAREMCPPPSTLYSVNGGVIKQMGA